MEVLRDPCIKGVVLVVNFVEFVKELDFVRSPMHPVKQEVVQYVHQYDVFEYLAELWEVIEAHFDIHSR